MLAFYPRFIRTFDDLLDHVSLLVHSWKRCYMRCNGCHNFQELIAEFLNESSEIEHFRMVFKGKVIVLTNGTSP